MTAVLETWPGPRGIPARILVAGSDLLADALASALETYGFATMNIAASTSAARDGMDWRPDLAIIDARQLAIDEGSDVIGEFSQAGVGVCVIDSVDDGDRFRAWLRAGSAALVDRCESFEEFFRTVTFLLRRRLLAKAAERYTPTWSPISAEDRGHERRLDPFAALTEREQAVLAELIEGHCAEDIANAGYVSISTVRSQIKAILQKLGVNSQLAAVAMARRADWYPQGPHGARREPTTGRRRQVS
jgi:DNA-binding NarL/FixJ family response regulator